MSYEKLRELSEKLSCEMVLAEPQNPETISALLPILKGIHSQCRSLSLNAESELLIEAKECLMYMMDHPDAPLEDHFDDFNTLMIQFSNMLNELDTVSEPEDEENQFSTPINAEEKDMYDKLSMELDEFDKLIASFCPGEIPDLGAMLNSLGRLLDVAQPIEPQTFYQIAMACREYVENMTLENIYNTKPVEEGLLLLKSILSHLRNNEPFPFDYSDVLDLLCQNIKKEQEHLPLQDIPDTDEKTEPVPESTPDNQNVQSAKAMSDDDIEIMTDFISEAVENLDSIEVNLIELEQDPDNTDIINDIFRPFHTIKGVSGFLSLKKINKLSHTTENLLDSARSGDFVINHQATDAILESVDALKKLISRLKEGLDAGMLLSDDDIDIEALREKLKALQISLTKGEKEPLGEILIRNKATDRQSVDEALELQKESPEKKIGEILIETQKTEPRQVASALMDQSHVKKKVDNQVKVSTRKLDDLVDYAGELVIAQSMLKQKTSHNTAVTQSVAQLGQIVTNIQNLAMSMRMIPIKATFMKMIRLVRDLSRKSGKDVDLNMFGEDTEIDRNVVDALYEPMVHMIRNSVDHGIEPQEDRRLAGKPDKGTINLRAYHKGGHIIIEIEDDGKGLDKDRILEKAKNTGLISKSDQMTDSQIYDLIMEPGFSTAKKITDVSGRGVGMDVVKSAIERFRGHLNVESEKGKGTCFTISLPLTLAIIDGMLVRVGEEKYIIPTIAIQKAFKPLEDEYFTVEGKGEMVKDRGSLIPIIRLNEIYQKNTYKSDVKDSLVVVVESKDEKRGLLIDELLGKDEYVIKSLGGNLEDVDGLAGGAILADGKVGLILDIHGIFSIASNE